MHLETSIFYETEIPVIPARREIPEAREIPESREFPGNSHTGNSREGNLPDLMGGREWEFPVEHPWGTQTCSSLPVLSCG